MTTILKGNEMFVEEDNLFGGMSPAFMNEISRHFVAEQHEAGTFLYRMGEPAVYLYILIEGRIRVMVDDHGQITHVVNHMGDAVGWSSLVEQEVHTASAECLTFCRVNKMKGETLAAIFDRDTASGLKFYRHLTKLFRQQLVDTYRLIPAAHGKKQTAPGF